MSGENVESDFNAAVARSDKICEKLCHKSNLIGNYKDGFQRDGNISKQVSSISVSQWAILVIWVTMCIVQFVPWPEDTAEIFSMILTSLLPYFLYISSIQKIGLCYLKKFTEVGSSLNYVYLTEVSFMMECCFKSNINQSICFICPWVFGWKVI